MSWLQLTRSNARNLLFSLSPRRSALLTSVWCSVWRWCRSSGSRRSKKNYLERAIYHVWKFIFINPLTTNNQRRFDDAAFRNSVWLERCCRQHRTVLIYINKLRILPAFWYGRESKKFLCWRDIGWWSCAWSESLLWRASLPRPSVHRKTQQANAARMTNFRNIRETFSSPAAIRPLIHHRITEHSTLKRCEQRIKN